MSFGAGNKDVYLIKTNSVGDTIWTQTYVGSGYYYGYCVQRTDDEGYIVAGSTISISGTDTDVWLIRLDREGVLIEQFPTPHPSSFILYPCNPNPFNASTAISYQLQAASFVELKVYDVTDREVAAIADGWYDAGIHEVTFDGSELASGIYFARLQVKGLTRIQKLLLLK